MSYITAEDNKLPSRGCTIKGKRQNLQFVLLELFKEGRNRSKT